MKFFQKKLCIYIKYLKVYYRFKRSKIFEFENAASSIVACFLLWPPEGFTML